MQQSDLLEEADGAGAERLAAVEENAVRGARVRVGEQQRRVVAAVAARRLALGYEQAPFRNRSRN